MVSCLLLVVFVNRCTSALEALESDSEILSRQGRHTGGSRATVGGPRGAIGSRDRMCMWDFDRLAGRATADARADRTDAGRTADARRGALMPI